MIALLVPRFWLIIISKALILICYPWLWGPKKVVKKNLYYTGEEITQAKVREVFFYYILFLIDFFAIKKLNFSHLHSRVQIRGLHHLDNLVKNQTAGILVTGHLGNWELAGIYLGALGYPLCAVVEDVGKPVKFLNELREKTGMETILTSETRKIIKAIKNRKIIVLLGDRDVTGTGLETPFLNGRKKLPLGPAYMAKKFNLPLLLGYFVYTKEGNYFEALAEPLNYSQNIDIIKLHQLIASQLGLYIKKYPTQWIVFQDEWRNENCN